MWCPRVKQTLVSLIMTNHFNQIRMKSSCKQTCEMVLMTRDIGFGDDNESESFIVNSYFYKVLNK